ncbi:MAG: orotate phosphoribosyltransferase [Acidimicrobiales bacterium]
MESNTIPKLDPLSELRRIVLARGYERREEPFALSSGGMSHDYVDLRRAVARGEDLRSVGLALAGDLATRGFDFDAIGGMTMGADPVAHAVAMLTGRAWYSVRKDAKRHGQQRRIEGTPIGEGVRAVVLEDTVSTGKSLVEACMVVRESGAEVVAACTILDRGNEVAPRLAGMGVRYFALLSYSDLGIEPIGPVD